MLSSGPPDRLGPISGATFHYGCGPTPTMRSVLPGYKTVTLIEPCGFEFYESFSHPPRDTLWYRIAPYK